MLTLICIHIVYTHTQSQPYFHSCTITCSHPFSLYQTLTISLMHSHTHDTHELLPFHTLMCAHTLAHSQSQAGSLLLTQSLQPLRMTLQGPPSIIQGIPLGHLTGTCQDRLSRNSGDGAGMWYRQVRPFFAGSRHDTTLPYTLLSLPLEGPKLLPRGYCGAAQALWTFSPAHLWLKPSSAITHFWAGTESTDSI